MRALILMVSVVGIIVVVGAILMITISISDQNQNGDPVAAVATSTSDVPVDTSSVTEPPLAGTPTSPSEGVAPAETSTSALLPPTAIPTSEREDDSDPTEPPVEEINDPLPELPPLEVGQPAFTYPLNELGNIDKWFSESYAFDNISVAWAPGAFPPERAEVVAQKTREALAEANHKLGTDFHGPVEIYVADQLFTDDCLGCQGFTAADLYMIFMLDDGSVTEAQFDALLVHEVVHLIAAHEIGLPHELFYAEGLAMWVMSGDIVAAGGVSPAQVTAWMYREGVLPSIEELFDDDFAGRLRKRVPYDAAGAFAAFVTETYGFETYSRLYTLEPPENVLGKTWGELEAEWHAWLEPLAGQEVNGVGAGEWWAVASQVIQGYYRFFEDPSTVSPEQYRDLSYARLLLNMAEIHHARDYLQASGLVGQTAQ